MHRPEPQGVRPIRLDNEQRRNLLDCEGMRSFVERVIAEIAGKLQASKYNASISPKSVGEVQLADYDVNDLVAAVNANGYSDPLSMLIAFLEHKLAYSESLRREVELIIKRFQGFDTGERRSVPSTRKTWDSVDGAGVDNVIPVEVPCERTQRQQASLGLDLRVQVADRDLSRISVFASTCVERHRWSA